MGAVFYLGAGWSQKKLLDTPDAHLPVKRGSRLNGGLAVYQKLFFLNLLKGESRINQYYFCIIFERFSGLISSTFQTIKK